MARGQADYGALAPKETTASVSDMGEIASRLGSIVTYDKRGDVVDFDNFEEPVIKYSTAVTGAESAIYLDSESCKSGSQSVKLVTGDVAFATVGLVKYLPVLGSLKLGLEESWNGHQSYTNLYIFLGYNTGIQYFEACIKLDLYTGKVYLVPIIGADEELEATFAPNLAPFTYNTLKLVVDFATGYYTRLLLGCAEYDLSAKAIPKINDNTPPLITIYIYLANQAATGGYCWIDDIIWTQAEP